MNQAEVTLHCFALFLHRAAPGEQRQRKLLCARRRLRPALARDPHLVFGRIAVSEMETPITWYVDLVRPSPTRTPSDVAAARWPAPSVARTEAKYRAPRASPSADAMRACSAMPTCGRRGARPKTSSPWMALNRRALYRECRSLAPDWAAP